MSFTKEDATAAAKRDLASRLGVNESSIEEVSIIKKDFPDMSLGAPTDGEMAAQMIATGWEIKLAADRRPYEYRADKFQLRLVDFDGENHIIR
jgi:hypothetical protein